MDSVSSESNEGSSYLESCENFTLVGFQGSIKRLLAMTFQGKNEIRAT